MGGPNKVRGWEKVEKLISGADVYLAPESKPGFHIAVRFRKVPAALASTVGNGI